MAAIMLSAERRLLIQLERKRLARARLTEEISRLEGRLKQIRRAGTADAPTLRSSSVTKALVQGMVLDRLRQNSPPETSAEQLWQAAQAAGVQSRSTFRSHLKRMKEAGLIVPVEPGRWSLSPQVSRERDISPELRRALAALDKQFG